MSRCGHYAGYNDDWIYAHMTKYTSWRNLFNAYYKEFHFGNYRNFRNHLYNDLGLTRKFTNEQNQWLIENYPHMTLKECTDTFNKKFNIGRSRQTICTQANKLGIKQNDETVKKSYLFEHYNSYPIGATVTRHTTTASCVYQKTESGWKRQTHLVMGDVPKGHVVVHLDGDYTNNSKENLQVITMRENALMTANKFWSEDPELRKTGLVWCKLMNVIGDEGKT